MLSFDKLWYTEKRFVRLYLTSGFLPRVRTSFMLSNTQNRALRTPPPHAYRSFAALFFITLSVHYEELSSVHPLVKRPLYHRDRHKNSTRSCQWRENRSWRKNPGKIVSQLRTDKVPYKFLLYK
jgi:hypothetical protein